MKRIRMVLMSQVPDAGVSGRRNKIFFPLQLRFPKVSAPHALTRETVLSLFPSSAWECRYRAKLRLAAVSTGRCRWDLIAALGAPPRNHCVLRRRVLQGSLGTSSKNSTPADALSAHRARIGGDNHTMRNIFYIIGVVVVVVIVLRLLGIF